MDLLARGRAADVFDAGPGLVLRRYRDDRDATAEAAVMSYAREQGFPVPRVESADGRDLVLERIDGPTMLAALAARPWDLRAQAHLLADLHHRLGTIAAPAGLRQPMGAGDRLLHLDLHPDNVLLGRTGPVVIDWTNAGAGPAAADVADTWLLIACARPDSAQLVSRLGQALLTRAFLAAAGRDTAREHLRAAFAHRVGDHNMSPGEVARMRALVRRETGSQPEG